MAQALARHSEVIPYDLGRKTNRRTIQDANVFDLRPKCKCPDNKVLGSVFADLGRLGRKFPEHLAGARGQGLEAR
jgi:hypothetical protein